MRKYYSLFSAVIITAWLFVSPCFGSSVVASIFPVYDWVREISEGSGTSITLLLNSGADLHSYRPLAKDIVLISSCDVFIYVGGESDEWAEDVLKTSGRESQKVINLLDVLGSNVNTEEIIEGMEHEHHHDHDEHDHEHEHEAHHHKHEHDSEPDEHIWLSLRNAEIICRKIAESSCLRG